MHHGSHFPLDAGDHVTSEQALRGDWTDNAARSDSSDGGGSLAVDLHNPMGSV